MARLHYEAEDAKTSKVQNINPVNAVPMKMVAGNLSIFDGYQLLDDISPDSLTNGLWQLYTPSGNPVLTRQIVPSPFGFPAGGSAFYQAVVGNTTAWCNAYHIRREFNL
ncbi:MAG: hypothetical protein Q7V05_10360, partial [Methanoregula sp.]|nr:hypothetical protein [Methanoregula sp.]